MKNVIFISPNFPENYWHFCHELKENGMNVLGIGDCPYDDLRPELQESLQEYYKVDSLENYDEVYGAVGYFIWHYGRIDWLESNNEYWLEQDARLRTDFNIPSGFHNEDMPRIKYKSRMKEYYQRVGIPVARYHIVDNYEGCLNLDILLLRNQITVSEPPIRSKFLLMKNLAISSPTNGMIPFISWKNLSTLRSIPTMRSSTLTAIRFLKQEMLHRCLSWIS